MFTTASSSYWLIALQSFGDFLRLLYTVVPACLIIVIFVLTVAGMWQVFEKAGMAGWKAIIPFYNIYILCEIIGRPGWWVFLYFIPIVFFFVWIVMMIDLAKSFDRGLGFAIGLMILPEVFYPILGFSDMQYYGPAAKS